MSAIRWLGELTEDGVTHYRVGRTDDERIAEWPDVARLVCGLDGADARFEAMPDVSEARANKLRNGLARALVRSLSGGITLHASAISFGKSTVGGSDGASVGVVGASGAGKSTLARALVETAGGALLADDMAPVELDGARVEILPSEHAVWLASSGEPTSDSELGPMDKAPHAVRSSSTAAPLSALVVLEFAPNEEPEKGPTVTSKPPFLRAEHHDLPREITLTPLRPAELLGALVPAVVRFALDDAAAQMRELAALGALCRRVPGYRLRRPRDARLLPATARLVAALAERPPHLP